MNDKVESKWKELCRTKMYYLIILMFTSEVHEDCL